MIFWGKIVNGKLLVSNKEKMERDVRALGRDGEVELTLKFKSKRSLRQNNYLHGTLIPEFRNALNSCGYRIKDNVMAKKILKTTFLTRHVENELTGEEIPYVLDTSDLDKKQMSELVDEVIQFAAEHLNGYQIPYPNEDLELGF